MSSKAELSEATPEEQNALSNLINRIEKYKDYPIGRIFLTRARRDINNLSIHIGERLVEFGLYLTHCSTHCNDGLIPFEKRDGIYLISPEYQDETFLTDIRDALKDTRGIINFKAVNALRFVRGIHNGWFNKVYGQQLTEETKEVMFDLPPVVIRWDQHLVNRPVFGDLWHVPLNTHAPVYDYLKMKSFPPAIFVSDRPENDLRQYVEGIAKETGKSRRDVLALANAHEQIHLQVTNTVSELCLPSIYHWWGEGVAIAYADIDNYQRREPGFYAPVQDLTTSEIITPVDGRFDYLGSVSTWLSLCSIAANKSTDPAVIYQMSDKFISDMCLLAELGNPIQPTEIPTKLLSADPQVLFPQIDQHRPIILEMLSRGQF